MSEAGFSPTRITVEWEVEKFFDLPLDDTYKVDTRSFPFSRGEYFLRLRPNGEKINNTAGWTTLFLMKKCSPSEDSIAYTMGIKRADGSTFASRSEHWLFVTNRNGIGLAICLRSQLIRHRNEVAPNGSLTLFCSAFLNSHGVKEAASQTSSSDNVLQTLSENFKNLFISGSQGDIRIKTKDRDFTAHRSVLAARSSVFQAMLEVDMVENNDGVITIEDCEASCLESFLLFLYGGDIAVVSAGNALGLYYLADKYNIPELKRSCAECLSRELSIDTVCDAARLAALYGETELLDEATDFFCNNMADIVSTPKWMSFFGQNPSIGNELLVKVADRLKDLSQKK